MDKPTPPDPRFAPGQECEHGQLARSCGLCDRDYEIAELRAQVEQYKEDADRYRAIAPFGGGSPLTNDVITSIAYDCNALPEVITDESLIRFVRAIEAIHGIVGKT